MKLEEMQNYLVRNNGFLYKNIRFFINFAYKQIVKTSVLSVCVSVSLSVPKWIPISMPMLGYSSDYILPGFLIYILLSVWRSKFWRSIFCFSMVDKYYDRVFVRINWLWYFMEQMLKKLFEIWQ